MKRKGFTLVELLAVIIILAIIASIAVSTVVKRIKKAEEEALMISLKEIVNEFENGVLEGIYEDEIEITKLNIVNNKFKMGTIAYDRENGEITIKKIGDKKTLEESSFVIMFATKEEIFANEVKFVNPKKLLILKVKESVGTDPDGNNGYYDEEDNYLKGGSVSGENETPNYIKIPEKDEDDVLYRIVRIFENGEILITRNNFYKEKKEFNETPSNNFDNSTLKEYLNCTGDFENDSDCFLNQVDNHKYIQKSIWDASCVDSNGNNSNCDDEISTKMKTKIGLLTFSDYRKVAYNNSYNRSYLYMSSYDDAWWLGTGSNEVERAFRVSLYNVYSDLVSTKCKIRPALVLKSNLTVTGLGTIEDPFVIEE